MNKYVLFSSGYSLNIKQFSNAVVKMIKSVEPPILPLYKAQFLCHTWYIVNRESSLLDHKTMKLYGIIL
jgi:hypothetical protein